LKPGPLLVLNIEHESFSSHRVLPSIASSTTEQHNLLLGNDCDGVTESGLRGFAVHFHIFDTLIALQNLASFRALRVVCTVHHDITREACRLVVILAGNI